MSRIDEALKQARLREGVAEDVETPQSAAPEALENFPASTDFPLQDPDPEVVGSEPIQSIVESAPQPVSVESHAEKPTQEPGEEPLVQWQSSESAAIAEKLIIHETANLPSVEQYRRIAAVLHQLHDDRHIKVVMIASAQVGEGKTLTATNVALTLSESYHRKVLLIDADLRRPSLTALFRLPGGTGLSEALKGNAEQPLRTVRLSERLALLPAGKPDRDPMAGLTSGRMQHIIRQAAANFEWVILDTSPVGLQTDAGLLSAMVDAIILVVRAGATQWAMIQRAIEALGRDKIVGVVLNRVDSSAFDEASYYSYYSGASRHGNGNGHRSTRAGT